MDMILKAIEVLEKVLIKVQVSNVTKVNKKFDSINRIENGRQAIQEVVNKVRMTVQRQASKEKTKRFNEVVKLRKERKILDKIIMTIKEIKREEI